jgi:hypothetical protein
MQNTDTTANPDTSSLEIAIRENLQRALVLSNELALSTDDRINFMSAILSAMQALPTQPE